MDFFEMEIFKYNAVLLIRSLTRAKKLQKVTVTSLWEGHSAENNIFFPTFVYNLVMSEV